MKYIKSVESIGNSTVKGLAWNGLNSVILFSVNFGVTILLTRLSLPKFFGIMGMASVVTNFLMVFQQFGFGAAIINKKKLISDDLFMIFWMQLAIGFVMLTLLLLSANFIAIYFDSPELVEVIYWLSPIFILTSFNNIQLSILKRNMEFKNIFLVNLVSVLFSGITSVLLVVYYDNLFGLVWKVISVSVAQFIMLTYFVKFIPLFRFSKSSFNWVFRYSTPLFGSKLIGYLMRNIDNVIIGKSLGEISLGLYTRSYSLMMLPANQLNQTVVNVLFSSFSKLQNDVQSIKRIWLTLQRILSVVGFFSLAIAMSFVEPIVLALFGKAWIGMIDLLLFLMPVGLFQILTQTGFVMNALGKTKLAFNINVSTNFILIIAIFIGVNFGLKGVVFCYFALYMALVPAVRWYYGLKFMNITLSEFWNRMKPGVLLFLIPSIALFEYRNLYTSDLIYEFFVFSFFSLFTIFLVRKQLFIVKGDITNFINRIRHGR